MKSRLLFLLFVSLFLSLSIDSAGASAKFKVKATSNTSVLITFPGRAVLPLRTRSLYQIYPPLKIRSATPSFSNRKVVLTTASQDAVKYRLRILSKKYNATARAGRGQVLVSPKFVAGFHGIAKAVPATPTPDPGDAGASAKKDESLPFMVGAISESNTSVIVGFSEEMNDSVLNPANFSIVQENVNPEVGAIKTTSAAWVDETHMSVRLATSSQSEVTYRVHAVNVYDLAGNPIQAKQAGIIVLVDPSSALFAGTPPGGSSLVDSDGDFLPDNQEMRGWKITVLLANGEASVREVTSDPVNPDTDGDGLPDGLEKALVTDPRSVDTDDDQLTDYQEFNEIFSDPTRQDSDADGIYDGLEWDFFVTSPILKDTDGDQLGDDAETILANRNARNADIPLPAIEIGDVALSLDVRFTASSAAGTRDLETKSISSTLQQTDNKKFSNSDSVSHEFTAKVAVEQGWSVGTTMIGQEGKVSVETGYTGNWTSSFSEETTTETQKQAAKTFSTDKEVTQQETMQREVSGASIKVAVTLKSRGNLAFSLENMQISAFVQDPRNPGRLIPLATLSPSSTVPNKVSLGPLVAVRGPFIFENDQIFPSVVENVMLDPRGIVFKVANYDITDELGRNFAFTSQEINDRTAPLIIDFGGADTDGDGEGDNTERYRVATHSGRVIDTNGDGVADSNDRRVSFDPNGKQVGITVREALEGIVGLTYYREEETPSNSLSDMDLQNSFSTRTMNGVEQIWRIRGVSKDLTSPLKQWVILTPTGIAAPTPLTDLILLPEKGVTFAFVQDLDNDGVTAYWEYYYGCSDVKTDTDGDGLNDWNEVYGGWLIQVAGKRSYKSYPSCARKDSDLDGIPDNEEVNRKVDMDTDLDGTLDLFDVPAPTDPKNPDTDLDGVLDYDEINGYSVKLKFPIDTNSDGVPDITSIIVKTDPLNPDTDGDTLNDGDEGTLGTDPTVDDSDKVLDDDGDGLRNFQETQGWSVTTYAVSTTKNVQGVATTISVQSLTNKVDTDGDGLTDRQEKDLGSNPQSADTDGDGLPDGQEVTVTYPAGVETLTKVTDPLDADTDNDLRSDGAEMQTPWVVTVNVTGTAPYSVYSDPNDADADFDGLVDGEEIVMGTDPNVFDTDGDGFGDGVESGTRGTDPLTPDQKVSFTFTSIKVVGDCDDGSGGSDKWVGELLMQLHPDEASSTMVLDINASGVIDDVDEGNSVTIDAGRTVIMSQGKSMTVSSNNLCDQDGSHDGNCSRGGDGDEILNGIAEDFAYPVSSAVKVYVQQRDNSDSCELDFTLRIDEVM